MIYYATKVQVTDKPLSQCEYEVLNELKSPYRSDDNCLYHTRFLFESDELELMEQLKLAQVHKDNINRITFSGKKSLHVVIEFPKEYESFCNTYYKMIWRYFASEWFMDKCDKACANPSRLTRRPDVTRKDTGKVQTLIYHGKHILDKEICEQCRKYVLEADRLQKMHSELVRRYRSYMATNTDVDCSSWNTVKRYLDTPFPHMTGNGNSSAWLYAALQTCKQYNDEKTLQMVIDKAKSENWTDKEIQHKLK